VVDLAGAPILSDVEVSECPVIGCANPTVRRFNGSGVATFAPVSDAISQTSAAEPYFRVGATPGYYPLILWPYFPLTHTARFFYPVPDRVAIDSNARVPLDSHLGHIAFILSDCRGRRPSPSRVRLRLKAPNEKSPIVASKLVPGPMDVGDSGGLIFNVTPGWATVDTFLEADGGARVGSRDVLIEEGTFTLVRLEPTP
jgi:hypothetical protein